MTESAQGELPLPKPSTWTMPRGKHTCGRNQDAGPGTCSHWWGGCENAEKRGCYQLWWNKQNGSSK